MNRFPRRYDNRRVYLIDVTFVPPETCFAMHDEEGRVFVWCRIESDMIQNREYFQTLYEVVLAQPPNKVVTPTMTEGFQEIDEEEARRYSRSLIRYIERGTAPEEESMLIIAYGCYAPANPDLQKALTQALTSAAA